MQYASFHECLCVVCGRAIWGCGYIIGLHVFNLDLKHDSVKLDVFVVVKPHEIKISLWSLVCLRHVNVSIKSITENTTSWLNQKTVMVFNMVVFNCCCIACSQQECRQQRVYYSTDRPQQMSVCSSHQHRQFCTQAFYTHTKSLVLTSEAKERHQRLNKSINNISV